MNRVLLCVGVVLGLVSQALAIDEEHRKKAEAMIAKATTYLKSQQDEKTGGWGVNPQAPVFPAISGLVINGMAMAPGFDAKDPAVARGVSFILSYQQADGGIYDKLLPSYNTSICISALARVGTPEAKAAVAKAVPFLKGLQYSEDSPVAGPAAGEVQRVTREHPFYGGVGYGNNGRPDLSNTSFFIQAMHDAGVPAEDAAYQRALVFLSRVQMVDSINDQAFADRSKQGGFIYATGPKKDAAGVGQSFAGEIEETMDDGTKVSRLRAYGSMTYAGFKSYVYAQLKAEDPRVQAAIEWITRNYTLAENPGVGTDGLYYYFVTFARTLDAWGREKLPVAGTGDPKEHDWANDLIDRLAELQNQDGSFKSVDDRWMENNPVLITAYGLLALRHAAN
jgi:squalene-hopene/tetraprenyl-beta-curcumene cyclase